MTYFTEQEKKEIELVKFDPLLKPMYDPMRDCLFWEDDYPPNWGWGNEKIVDLLIARLFIHKGLPKSNWYAIAPTDYFVNAWESAIKQGVKWPGFNRLQLSQDDIGYLERMRENDDI